LYGRGAARVPPTQTNALNSSWESMMTNVSKSPVEYRGKKRGQAVEEEDSKAVHGI